MTKVVKLIAENEATESKKKIEFVFLVTCNKTFVVAPNKPHEWDNVSILCRKSDNDKYDIMIAWDNDSNEEQRAVYLGHWNDGVI